MSPRVSVPVSPALTWACTMLLISSALMPSGTASATAELTRLLSWPTSISGAGSARTDWSTIALTSAAESWPSVDWLTMDSTSARVRPAGCARWRP